MCLGPGSWLPFPSFFIDCLMPAGGISISACALAWGLSRRGSQPRSARESTPARAHAGRSRGADKGQVSNDASRLLGAPLSRDEASSVGLASQAVIRDDRELWLAPARAIELFLTIALQTCQARSWRPRLSQLWLAVTVIATPDVISWK